RGSWEGRLAATLRARPRARPGARPRRVRRRAGRGSASRRRGRTPRGRPARALPAPAAAKPPLPLLGRLRRAYAGWSHACRYLRDRPNLDGSVLGCGDLLGVCERLVPAIAVEAE